MLSRKESSSSGFPVLTSPHLKHPHSLISMTDGLVFSWRDGAGDSLVLPSPASPCTDFGFGFLNSAVVVGVISWYIVTQRTSRVARAATRIFVITPTSDVGVPCPREQNRSTLRRGRADNDITSCGPALSLSHRSTSVKLKQKH